MRCRGTGYPPDLLYARVTAPAAAPNSAEYVLAITRTSWETIDGRHDRQIVEPEAAIVHPVDEIAVVRRLRAVDAIRVAREQPVSAARLRVRRARGRARHQLQDLCEDALVQRYFRDLLIRNQRRYGLRLRLEHRRRCIYLDGLLYVSDGHLQIYGQDVGRRKHRAGANEPLKARLFHRDADGTNGKKLGDVLDRARLRSRNVSIGSVH